MKPILSLLTFLLITTSLVAQTAGLGTAGGGSVSTGTPLKGNTKIVGTVVDSVSSSPVEFANIALMDAATDKPVNGALADEKGKFTITKVAEGNYNVVISFLGYETTTIRNIHVEEKKDEIDLGNIKLQMKVEVLKEVVVEGQKNLIEERVDRTIYNAENDMTTKGGDATDVLKRVPMLSVDLDGNVSMRGSSNIQVLINNKPSTIVASSVADALKQIPADQIKTVEVITSPSAKYDAEGSGGIINIITKKNTLEGLTLGVDAGVGIRGSNLGLNGNFRRGKMGFSLGGWGRANYNISGRFENSQTTKDANGEAISYTTQEADTRNQGLFGNYNIGWDYDINPRNFVTASVRFGARNNTSYQDDLFSQTTSYGTTNNTLRNTHTEDLSNNVDANFSYTRTYETPQRELSFMGGYSRNNRNNDFENLVTEVNGDISAAGSLMNKNESYNEETTFQVDYQTPIGTNQMIEFGGKDILRKAVSDYTYFVDPEGDGSFTESGNSNFSNNLNYDQNVIGGYLSYTYSAASGYSFKAGSRYEYTTINAYTQTDDDIDIPSYGALVPSVNISKKLANGKTLKASYNRRIQRPSIRYLNPNVQASNPYNISYGNPELDPEYTNNYELSYSTFIKGTTLNFSTFWRNTNNGIQDVRTIVADTVIETTYRNIGKENTVGVNVFANVVVGKLMLNGGTDLYYAMLNNNLPADDANAVYSASNEGWVMSYRLFGSYNLTKGWGFQFFGFYRGRQIQLQGTQGGFGIYSLGLRKEFNNKKGSVGFGAENFFTKEFRIKGESNSPTYSQKSLNVLHNMSFRANISYRIGKMSVDAKPRRRKSISNDDLKEGDGGGGGGQDSGGGNPGGQRSAGGGNPGGGQRSSGGGNAPQGAGKATVAPVILKTDTAAVVKPEGTWSYTVESPQGGEGTLVITNDGDNLSGTINNKRFNRDMPLTSVSLNGNELTFSYHVSFGGNEMDIQVKAIITGDTLSGNMMVGQFGTFPINAKRQ
jgi:outer membrane receptor protein involved in Fe transport